MELVSFWENSVMCITNAHFLKFSVCVNSRKTLKTKDRVVTSITLTKTPHHRLTHRLFTSRLEITNEFFARGVTLKKKESLIV